MSIEPAAAAGVVRAATLLAVGNIASRVLGLAREMVIAYLFGATGLVSIFRVAATLVQTLYDFLVGGMVTAALVPVFSEYAAKEKRAELWRVASVVTSVIALGLALAILILQALAPQVVIILGGGYDPALQSIAVGMIRLILPAIFFLGISGLVTGLLYSLNRFTYPAFTAAAFNLGIVLVALLLSPYFGISSLIFGVLVGSAAQVALLLFGLRDARYEFVIDLKHPVVKRILTLYAPVAAGLTISVIGVAIDRNLASHTGAQSLAWMQSATALIQFPLGLVGTAISFAILPALSQVSHGESSLQSPSESRNQDFRSTLALGLKMVLLIILPSATGLFVLAQPIVSLLYERGAFTAFDASQTALALQFYLIGLPFAAIDQPLVFAFYARKNTLLPNLVAVASVAVYLVVALSLMRTFGMIGLVIANSAQLTSHALMMLWFAETRLGGFGKTGLGTLTLRTSLASLGMALITFLVWGVTQTVVEQVSILQGWSVLVPLIVGALSYLALLKILRVREASQIWELIASRWQIAR